MGTISYAHHRVYLIVNRDGGARVRQTRPYAQLPAEYVFEVTVRVPTVKRPAIAGEVTVELPPDVDPDVSPAIDTAGPVDLPELP